MKFTGQIPVKFTGQHPVKLTGRIPVESLSDERWTRIERTIVSGASDASGAARPVRRTRSVPILAAAAALLLVLGAGAIGWKLHGGAADREVIAEAPIHVRAHLRSSVIDIGDATISSDPSAAFTVTRPAGGVLVALARGKIELAVLPRGARAPLVVQAGDTDVIVVGTRFSVDYGDGTGDVDVRVTEGVVRVVRHRREVRVAAGQAWSSQRGTVVPLSGVEAAAADRTGSGATIAAGGSRANDDIAIDMGEAPKVLRDRVAVVPTVDGANGASRANATARGSTGSTGYIRGQGGRGKAALDNPRDPQFDLKSSIRSQPVLPALDVGEPDPRKALAEYRHIMTRDKSREAHALYSTAVIEALKLGRTNDALGTLGALKRLAPADAYYVAALWLEVRIRCLRQIDDECRQAAQTYVRRAPEGSAFRVAEKIVAK